MPARAGRRRGQLEILGWRASAAAFGPMPVEQRSRPARSSSACATARYAVATALPPARTAAPGRRRRFGAASARGQREYVGRLRPPGWISHRQGAGRDGGGPAAAAERLQDIDQLSAWPGRPCTPTTAAVLAQHAEGLDDSHKLSSSTMPRQRTWWPGDGAQRPGAGARPYGCAPTAERLAHQPSLFAPTNTLTDGGDALLALAEILALRRPRARHGAAARQGGGGLHPQGTWSWRTQHSPPSAAPDPGRRR